MNRTLYSIEHRLLAARGLLLSAARSAESLPDQELADDLHMAANDLTIRVIPAVQKDGRLRPTRSRPAYLYDLEGHDSSATPSKSLPARQA